MKNLIKNLILFLVLTLAQSAFSYVLTSEELKQDILKEVNLEVQKQIKNYSSDYSIDVIGVLKDSIITSENAKPKIEIISQNNSFQPNSYKRVMIRNSDNSLVKAFPITIQTRVYADVLTAQEIIAYNEPITSKNSQNDLISKRNYQAGSVIVANYAKEKSCILKNSSIDIVFQSKSMNIKLRGKALKEGSIGDTILVRSDKYNKTYTGIVKSENEVMVRI